MFFFQRLDMSESKGVLSVAALLIGATGFCIYQVNSEKKVRHHSEIKSESRCEKEYKRYFFDGGYYLVDEDIVACNCTWLYGGKRCENYMWWT